MTVRDELARKALAAVIFYKQTGHDLTVASAGTSMADEAFELADAVLAAGYTKPQTGRCAG